MLTLSHAAGWRDFERTHMNIGTDVRNINDGRKGKVAETPDPDNDSVLVKWRGKDGLYRPGRYCKRYNVAIVPKRRTGELWARRLSEANNVPLDEVLQILAEQAK